MNGGSCTSSYQYFGVIDWVDGYGCHTRAYNQSVKPLIADEHISAKTKNKELQLIMLSKTIS